MILPNNESRVCDAVVRTLEKWTRETRSLIRHPDKEGTNPPVDLRLKLGTQEYAIEHTRIESFENQISTFAITKTIIRYVRKHIPVPFPSLAYYSLQFPTNVLMPGGRSKRSQALGNLVAWFREKEQILRERNSHCIVPVQDLYIANDRIRGKPPGFNCEFELLHWPIAQFIRREPGTFSFRYILPKDEEGLRLRSLQQTLSKKCPKLQKCKAEGARTVLILESSDPGLSSFEFRSNLLPSLLAECANAPDEIFLVETSTDNWLVQLLKRDEAHWPDTGMPKIAEFYYDPDTPGPGIPEYLASFPQHMRDTLQLDRMYTPFLPGWAPMNYEKDELENLMENPAG